MTTKPVYHPWISENSKPWTPILTLEASDNDDSEKKLLTFTIMTERRLTQIYDANSLSFRSMNVISKLTKRLREATLWIPPLHFMSEQILTPVRKAAEDGLRICLWGQLPCEKRLTVEVFVDRGWGHRFTMIRLWVWLIQRPRKWPRLTLQLKRWIAMAAIRKKLLQPTKMYSSRAAFLTSKVL